MTRTRPESVRVTGPLADYTDAFADELRSRRYTEVSAWHQLRLFSQLSRWLEQVGLEPHELTGSQVARFLSARRVAAPTGPRTERAMDPMLGYLRRIGTLPEAVASEPQGPVEILLERYRRYLVRERGLAATTIARYASTARLFLGGRPTMDGFDLSGLSATEVMQFVLRESQRQGAGSAKNLVTELRSLLRFLHMDGLAPPLADVVPSVAGWGATSLPRGLDPVQVERLLDGCDLETAVGRRDRAMLLLLVRLGLRAGEVVALELDDFDWRRGEVVIRGKGSRRELLPLPVDVGETVSSYIQSARPQIHSRRLFLRSRAPLDGELTVSSVKAVVRLACERANVTPVGAHRLRHSAATQMLRAGASLAEVGQVLRHRSLATTMIYAKVDRTALRDLARPWPGVPA